MMIGPLAPRATHEEYRIQVYHGIDGDADHCSEQVGLLYTIDCDTQATYYRKEQIQTTGDITKEQMHNLEGDADHPGQDIHTASRTTKEGVEYITYSARGLNPDSV